MPRRRLPPGPAFARPASSISKNPTSCDQKKKSNKRRQPCEARFHQKLFSCCLIKSTVDGYIILFVCIYTSYGHMKSTRLD
uniref:Uncharacterized protein n=1 Tax=Triticum urartu TaxID=4572 RepID=A0A8R7P1Z0_TRIUA